MKLVSVVTALVSLGPRTSLAFLPRPAPHLFREGRELAVTLQPIDFGNFLKDLLPGASNAGSEEAAKAALLDAVVAAKTSPSDSTEDAVRIAFTRVEEVAPAKETLLDDEAAITRLDGEWVLEYTVAAFDVKGGDGEEGEENMRGVRGSVNATGITVDTSAAGTRTTQTFDFAAGRVANNIAQPGPFGVGTVQLQVAGSFQRSNESGRRANVRFDNLNIKYGPIDATFAWLFAVVDLIKKDKQTQWLETTHLSKTMRLGRGNKGSIFVLTRPE
eukprot:CAMPEP_0185775414 /NCGR_PEP_ID=MMETSP1174-20130828/81963_1 /TAXON_ID=35687 /ORGANISM="Dictyocha speculum, Strain CCMP1381" /LENGTH=272 /DNA_ID=CAMNT_0028462979 /DNA_START=25 /DNA_END=843 /DNA_ORIENTATION=+